MDDYVLGVAAYLDKRAIEKFHAQEAAIFIFRVFTYSIDGNFMGQVMGAATGDIVADWAICFWNKILSALCSCISAMVDDICGQNAICGFFTCIQISEAYDSGKTDEDALRSFPNPNVPNLEAGLEGYKADSEGFSAVQRGDLKFSNIHLALLG